MSITINDESFPSQKAARARAGEILHRHPLMEPITGPDLDFVLALFLHHPRARQKAGAGLRHFVVGNSLHGPVLNFFVVRTDGTYDDFSIKQCVAAAACNTDTKELR